MRTYRFPSLTALAVLSFGVLVSTLSYGSTPLSAPDAASAATVLAAMDDSVAAYRKTIVLMDNAAVLDAGNRERVKRAAAFHALDLVRWQALEPSAKRM